MKPNKGAAYLMIFFAAAYFSHPAMAVEPPKRCLGKPVTILGTHKDDVLVGTAHRDVIKGRHGADSIFGLSGKDLLCGSRGHDRIEGGNDDDIDEADGGRGRDRCDAEIKTRCERIRDGG